MFVSDSDNGSVFNVGRGEVGGNGSGAGDFATEAATPPRADLQRALNKLWVFRLGVIIPLPLLLLFARLFDVPSPLPDVPRRTEFSLLNEELLRLNSI